MCRTVDVPGAPTNVFETLTPTHWRPGPVRDRVEGELFTQHSKNWAWSRYQTSTFRLTSVIVPAQSSERNRHGDQAARTRTLNAPKGTFIDSRHSHERRRKQSWPRWCPWHGLSPLLGTSEYLDGARRHRARLLDPHIPATDVPSRASTRWTADSTAVRAVSVLSSSQQRRALPRTCSAAQHSAADLHGHERGGTCALLRLERKVLFN